MSRVQVSLSLLVAAAAVFAGSAQAASPSRPGASPPRLHYLLQAEPLGHPTGAVEVRFEYLAGDGRILGVESRLVEFAGAEAVAVAIPRTSLILADDLDAQNPTLHVVAGGLVVNAFDRETLLAYDRMVRLRFPKEIALAGGPGGDRQTGGPQGVICLAGCNPGCTNDMDCDSVVDWLDNCPDNSNPGQADCDGDGFGDICDATDGIFQPTGAVKTCMTDKDDHVVYFSFEHHVEQRLVDVSNCHAADRWSRWVRSSADCFNISDSSCCTNGIGTSIGQVGDSVTLWCGSNRNIDLCH